jgi:hypothetical protein
MAIVDKGYKGAAIDGIQIWRSGQRTQSKTLKKMMKQNWLRSLEQFPSIYKWILYST